MRKRKISGKLIVVGLIIPVLIAFMIYWFIPPNKDIYTESNWILANTVLSWQFDEECTDELEDTEEHVYYFSWENKIYYIKRFQQDAIYIQSNNQVYTELPENSFGGVFLDENFLYYTVNEETKTRFRFEEGEGFPFMIFKIKYRQLNTQRINLEWLDRFWRPFLVKEEEKKDKTHEEEQT